MNKIITIGREFGSGGRELGRRLAEELGFAYYDYEIIEEIAKRTDLSEEYIKKVIEHRPSQLYPIMIARTFSYVDNYVLQQNIKIFQQQKEIIQELAEKSDCIFVGRCADYILKDMKPFRLFVYADMESKIARCRKKASTEEHLTDKEMKKNILKMDKNRAQYYEYYTGHTWGDKLNYDLCINTSNVVIKEIAPILARLVK